MEWRWRVCVCLCVCVSANLANPVLCVQLVINIRSIKTCWFMRVVEMHENNDVDLRREVTLLCAGLILLLLLSLLFSELSLTLWPSISISISEVSSFVSGVSSLRLWEEGDCRSGHRRACIPPSLPFPSPPLFLSLFPSLSFPHQLLVERLRGDHLKAEPCGVVLDFARKAQTADSFDRWLWNGACFYDSVLLFIAPCCSHAPLRTTHHMPGRGPGSGAERKPSATHTDISRD